MWWDIGADIFWIWFAYKVILNIYSRIIKPKFDWSQFRGEWALVTGSSDGSGKSLAFSAAKRGLNVVLVSRSQGKMDNISKEIQQKYGVKTKIIAVDFTQDDQDAVYKTIEKEISGLTISVLIHNVGGSGDSFTKLDVPFDYCYKLPWSYDEYMMRLNLIPALRITKLILPSMVQRKKGAVMSVSTLASCFGTAFLSPYTYSKAALNMFTSNLREETKGFNITVAIAYPGAMTTTGLINSPVRAISEMGACTPDQFSEAAMNTFGRELHNAPYWMHDLQLQFVHMIPTSLVNMMLTSVGAKMKAMIEKGK